MRYQHNGSWYRTSSSRQVGASGPDPGDSLEMPSMGYPLEDVPVFMLSVDQKQNQWSACHFLADAESGLGICCFFRGDKYHRSWRDWQWATSHAEGHHDWTSIQLNYVVNINYQPVGVGGHYGKRAEMNLEFGQLFPRAGPDFESLVQNISLDTRQPPPTGLGGVQELYRTLLDDDLGTRKGAFMKQSAWYDIIKHIDKYDPLWHCRRFEMEQLASFLRGRGYESKAFVKPVAKHILPTTGETETTKETFQSHMRHLRKSAGNCLLLAPRLIPGSCRWCQR